MAPGRKAKGSSMEALTINAVYENGKLAPLTPLPCHDKEQVLLKVVRHSNVDKDAATGRDCCKIFRRGLRTHCFRQHPGLFLGPNL